MNQRFCPTCNSEVEESGGFCLLGHRLTLDAPIPSLRELRAEVDQAFEEARVEVGAAMASIGAAAPPPPPPPPGSMRASQASLPTQRAAHPRRTDVWEALEQRASSSGSDPITAFAPPPRMDWGPRRGRLRLPGRNTD